MDTTQTSAKHPLIIGVRTAIRNIINNYLDYGSNLLSYNHFTLGGTINEKNIENIREKIKDINKCKSALRQYIGQELGFVGVCPEKFTLADLRRNFITRAMKQFDIVKRVSTEQEIDLLSYVFKSGGR